MTNLYKIIVAQTKIGALAGRAPFVADLYGRHIWRRRENTFFGVFDSYEAARAAVPEDMASSWDDGGVAEDKATPVSRMAVERDLPVMRRELPQPSVYASFYWLEKLLKPGDLLVDFGGATGDVYDFYHRHSALPEGAVWKVVEVPAMAAQGRRRAAADGLTDLEFEDRLEAIEACDLLLTAGCLQYLSPGEARIFDRMAARPAHVIVNKLPLTDGPDYWSLQNIYGKAATPYHVFNRDALLGYFAEHGYEPIDHWSAAELSVSIPFHPERHVPHPEGFVFKKKAG